MKIPKTTHNKIERQIKGINYAVKNRKGIFNHLKARCGKDVVDEFIKEGFLTNSSDKTGNTIYKITPKGDQYYKEHFGNIEYYKARIVGFFERIKKNF